MIDLETLQKIDPNAKIIKIEPNRELEKEVNDWIENLNKAYKNTKNSSIRFKGK